MLVPHSSATKSQLEVPGVVGGAIESIDNIVLEAIRNVDTNIFSIQLLEDIYTNTTIADIE